MKRFLSVFFVLAVALLLTGCKSSEYKNAKELASNGEYEKAITAFVALGDYKDSDERAIILQIQQFICEFGEAGDSLGTLTPIMYDAEIKSIEGLANRLVEFAEEFDSSSLASDDELSEIVDKLNVGGQGILLLIEMNRESIDEYNASAFTVLSPTMKAYLSNSKDAFRSVCKQIRAETLPEKYDGWY